MHSLPGPFRVYVGLVPTGYLVPEAIDRAVRAGLAYCGAASALERLRADRRLLIVPDVTMAEPKIARHGYTNPEVLRSVLSAALSTSPGSTATVLGRTIPGFPGVRVLKRAGGGVDRFRAHGYFELERMFPGRVAIACADRREAYRYQISKGGVLMSADRQRLLESGILAAPSELLRNRLSNEIVASRDFQDSGYVIACPKIKSSALSQGFSGAVRLGAGPDTGPLADFHACDMLEICNPDLVVSDGIIAAVGGSQFTQRGHELGVVLAANNALAHDLVVAQLLNLDPLRINHLKIAIERSWGPASLSQIELGGDGLEAIRQLAQKTKYWDLGAIAVEDFKAKFERDNPGLTFPVEIVSGAPYEASGDHGAFLEWLYLTYDSPALRPQMARWPRVSVCIGRISRYPSQRLVFAVGDAACHGLERLTSTSRRLLGFGQALSLESGQLKCGSRHFFVKIRGAPPSLRRLVAAFAAMTAGMMLPRVLTPALFVDRLSERVSRLFESRRRIDKTRIVLASRLPQNSWWALKPTSSSYSERSADLR